MLLVPFGRQGGERLGLLAPMDLRFDSRRTAIGSRRAIRSKSWSIAHLLGTFLLYGENHPSDSPYHAGAVLFKHRDFMGFA